MRQRGFRYNLTPSRTKKNCAPRKFSEFSENFRPQIDANAARRVAPALRGPCGDLLGCVRGRAACGSADFDAISRDLERKILRAAEIFEIFRPRIDANAARCVAPALHGPVGRPVRMRARPSGMRQHDIRSDLTRSRTKNLARRENFRKFSAANRYKCCSPRGAGPPRTL